VLGGGGREGRRGWGEEEEAGEEEKGRHGWEEAVGERERRGGVTAGRKRR